MTLSIRKTLQRAAASEYCVVFSLCLLLLFAEAYSVMASFEVQHSGDPRSYWGLAHFDFHQVAVRKYRVIIPFIAAGINWIIMTIAGLVRPGSLTGDYAMKVSFFIPNMICSAIWCTLIYRIVRALGQSRIAALVALAMATSAHYTILNAATPMVDAFFYCNIGFGLLGAITGNVRMLFWSVIIGPFAKESFIFLVPVLFLFENLPKRKLIVWLVISGLLQLAYRFVYDRLAGEGISASLMVDVDHINYLQQHLRRFIDISWLHDIFSFIGLWPLVPIAALIIIPSFGKDLRAAWRWWMALYLTMVLVQMLLSGELGRMLYIALPVYAWLIAFTVDAFRKSVLYLKTK